MLMALCVDHKNRKDKHYFAIAVDTKNDKLHIYDSLQRHKYPTEQRAKAWYREMVGKKSHHVHIVHERVPQQPDDYQCVPWTCANLMAFSIDKKLPEAAFKAPAEWSARFRKYLLAAIWNKTLFLN
jgi:Ulp1 family protease